MGALMLAIDLTYFIMSALLDTNQKKSLSKRIGYSPLIKQIVANGIHTIPVISLLGIATGIIITYRMFTLADVVGSEYIVTLLVDIVGMELGPIITAIILISRSGTATAVELANMKLHHEIETIELLGINLNNFSITPRLIGMSISQLMLSVYFTVIALVSGVLIGSIIISPAYISYLSELITAFTPIAVLTFTVKNLLFGLFIGAAGCFFGLRVEHSPDEVPRVMQGAVISSLLLVFFTDGLFLGVLQ